MPDIQTELFTKVIPKMKLDSLKFDDDVGAQDVQVQVDEDNKVNYTSMVYHFIKTHPGCLASDVVAGCNLLRDGASTRITQLISRGLLKHVFDASFSARRYYVTDKPYQALTKEEKIKRLQEARAASLETMKRKREEKLAKTKAKRGRPPKSAAKPVVNVEPTFQQSTTAFINSLSVLQAREVYDQLKKIFGG
jgi:predicted transcriptional regulator